MESTSGKGVSVDGHTGSICCYSRHREPWMPDQWSMYPTTRKHSKLSYGSERFETRLQCPLLFPRSLSLIGWSDIGYNFLISENGWIYEGRGWKRVGSHRIGYNSRSIGKTYSSDRYCSFLKMYLRRHCYHRRLQSKRAGKSVADALESLIRCGISRRYIAFQHKVLGQRHHLLWLSFFFSFFLAFILIKVETDSSFSVAVPANLLAHPSNENLLINTAKEQVLWNRNCCNLFFSTITFPWMAAGLVFEDSSIRIDTDLVSFERFFFSSKLKTMLLLLAIAALLATPIAGKFAHWGIPFLTQIEQVTRVNPTHILSTARLVDVSELRTAQTVSTFRICAKVNPRMSSAASLLRRPPEVRASSWCYCLKLTRVCLSLAGGCPTIVSRAGWGARAATSRTTMSTPVSYVVIHHTTGGTCTTKDSCISKMKGFQNYHMDSNGTCRPR